MTNTRPHSEPSEQHGVGIGGATTPAAAVCGGGGSPGAEASMGALVAVSRSGESVGDAGGLRAAQPAAVSTGSRAWAQGTAGAAV